MRSTRVSLLARVRDLGDAEAWERFYELYAPLLQRFARGLGLSASDAQEVRDQCLAVLARELPRFDYDPARGSFKSWLYRVARAKVVDLRREQRPAEGADWSRCAAHEPEPGAHWDSVWTAEHLLYALERVRPDVSARDFRAFEMLLVDDVSVDEVARALAMNANQVYKAKSRILARVRAKLRTLEAEGA